MSHSASSRPRPGRTVWHRWGYWPLFAGLLPGCLGPLLWHCAPSGEKNKYITPGLGGNVTSKTPAWGISEGTHREPRCIPSPSDAPFVVFCTEASLRPGPGVPSGFHLHGQWPVPVHPAMILLWVRSDRRPHDPRAFADPLWPVTHHKQPVYSHYHKYKPTRMVHLHPDWTILEWRRTWTGSQVGRNRVQKTN